MGNEASRFDWERPREGNTVILVPESSSCNSKEAGTAEEAQREAETGAEGEKFVVQCIVQSKDKSDADDDGDDDERQDMVTLRSVVGDDGETNVQYRRIRLARKPRHPFWHAAEESLGHVIKGILSGKTELSSEYEKFANK